MKNFFLHRYEMKKRLYFLILMICFSSGKIHAYTDQITVKTEEAWAAAQTVLKSKGFQRIDEKNLTLESKWITDRVVRSRGLFKKFASQTYERRYRLTVKITRRDYDTEIEVTGKFQERPVETNQHLILWRKYRPEGSDYDIERQTFMQILNRLELARVGQ